MDETPRIVPVTDLRRHAASLIEEVNRSERPLFVSQRGYLTAVLLSCGRYERLLSEAKAGDRDDRSARRRGTPWREPHHGREYGPVDYETARLLEAAGYETELSDLPEGWLGHE